jgi:ligand-binding SRPBCC domain-containing protein
MPTLEFVCELNVPLERVWEFHNDVATLFKLTPPEKHAKLEGTPEPMRAGVVYRILVRQFGILPVRMQSKIVEYTPPNGFVDIQVPGKGPFKSWTHRHQFAALPGGHTCLTDHVTYELPFGPLGALVDGLIVRRDIDRMFAYRHRATRDALEGTGGASGSERQR